MPSSFGNDSYGHGYSCGDDNIRARGITAATYEYTDGSTERRTASSTPPPPKPKPLNRSGAIDGIEIPPGVVIKSHQRASTLQRERYMAHLSACFGNGQLDKEQFDVRQRLAAEAETDAELRLLITDLPALTEVTEEAEPDKSLRELLGGWVSGFFGSPVKFFADARARLILAMVCVCASVALAAIPTSMAWGSHDPSGLAIGVGVFFLVAGVVCGIISLMFLVDSIERL